MSCDLVGALISELLDRRLGVDQRGEVLAHLAGCRKCRDRFDAFERVRASLGSMRSVPVPPRLSAQLRIAASKERVRAVSRVSFTQWMRHLRASAKLTIDNMMRPLALPFAGGVLSAFVLFSSLVPSLAFQRDYRNDVPTMLYTDPALEEVGYSHISADDTILVLLIDERGRVMDSSIPQGKMSPEMVNDLLFYRFAPATSFGVPTWGRVIITFRRTADGNRIVVRG
jgi:hypothetical protein